MLSETPSVDITHPVEVLRFNISRRGATRLTSKPRFSGYKDITPQLPRILLEATGQPKHHTQHDIINNTSPWASSTLVMIQSRERKFLLCPT